MTITERFDAIADVAAAVKRRGGLDGRARRDHVGAADVAAHRIARQQAQSVDFATSNLRTSPIPYFIAGAKALETYAIGPLGGVAFNVTMLSYVKHLDLGVNIDTAAVDDPALLAKLSTAPSAACAAPLRRPRAGSARRPRARNRTADRLEGARTRPLVNSSSPEPPEPARRARYGRRTSEHPPERLGQLALVTGFGATGLTAEPRRGRLVDRPDSRRPHPADVLPPLPTARRRRAGTAAPCSAARPPDITTPLRIVTLGSADAGCGPPSPHSARGTRAQRSLVDHAVAAVAVVVDPDRHEHSRRGRSAPSEQPCRRPGSADRRRRDLVHGA